MDNTIAIGLAVVLGAIGLAAAQAADAPAGLTPNDWLLSAPDDTDRFRRLQTQLRGMDQPMWEVGMRYEAVHEALKRGNYDLAIYHWDKVKTSIDNALVKRPARRASAESLFLNAAFAEVRNAFASKDATAAWAGFDRATKACKDCHDAEKLGFMNDMPMFELKR